MYKTGILNFLFTASYVNVTDLIYWSCNAIVVPLFHSPIPGIVAVQFAHQQSASNKG